VRRWSAVHRALYRMTRGAIGRRLVDNDILLLTTTGHLTGRPHTVPLLYLRDGEALVVIASYGGRPQHPTWYENLVADRNVRVQVNGSRRPMTARTANTRERRHWWPTIEAAYEGYSVYQSRTDRMIPVVFLEPVDQC
jgi:deazaflavin-dependent oxidoreductase (nitroreductase family)